MKYRLQCKHCGEVFVHYGNAFPNRCPLEGCGAYVGLNGKPEVTLPFISKAANKSPDVLNRVMEEGAQHRINMAAEMTGQPASDFAALAHTNMRDNVREGDITHSPVQTDLKAEFGNSGINNQEHALTIAGVKSGPYPNQGAKEINNIKSLHARHGAEIVRRGSIRSK
jgi:hypothetical protein